MLTHRDTTTTLSPERLPTPPPLALDLHDMDRPVGWIEGDVIGFRGFASDTEAAHAAWVAYRTIARRLARADGRRPIPVAEERPAVSRRDGVDVVLASGAPIATLVRPDDASRGGADSFGFEIRVPPTYEARMRALAYLAYRALRKSGVRWAMWTGERDRIAHEKRAAREAREAHLEREALAGMTPWRPPARGDGPRRRAARRDAIAAESIAAAAIARMASPPRGIDWGMAFLGVVLFLALALLLPDDFGIPLIVALGAVALAGLVSLPRGGPERPEGATTTWEDRDAHDTTHGRRTP